MGVCFIRFTVCSYSVGGVQLIFVILYLVYGCKLIQTLIQKKVFFQYYKNQNNFLLSKAAFSDIAQQVGLSTSPFWNRIQR